MTFQTVLATEAVTRYLGHQVSTIDTEFTYSFDNFFHPYVGELIERLNRGSVANLLDPVWHESLTANFFTDFYKAAGSDMVVVEGAPKQIDLSEGGPYAVYNWELLFHVPLTIAVHLSKNQRFAEARRWFHYIFDPTSTDTSVPVPQRFWRFLAFRRQGAVAQIDEQLAVLSKPVAKCTHADLELKERLLQGYEAIKNDPFKPHKVARVRHLAYQYCVVMKYLDNLIAWGDSLFRQDTSESIGEATQLYVLAANLLGRRPQRIPQTGVARPKTFAELRKAGLDALGNTLVELEGRFPLSLGAPSTAGDDPDAAGPMFGVGRALYFCVPRNDKLLGYWDTVADRLFKIRNSMNIEGVVRTLALFDPPIDPGLLVKAAAAGLDVGAVVAGASQPLSPVRATVLIQKALELCAEVRSLGSGLLAAIEKGDVERLAQLRQGHETEINRKQQEVRFLQWANAQETTKSLLVARNSAVERLRYYEGLLGAEPSGHDTIDVDFAKISFTEENFAEAYTNLIHQYDEPLTYLPVPKLEIAEADEPTSIAGYSGDGKVHLSKNEDTELNTHLPAARDATVLGAALSALAAGIAVTPDATADMHFWGIGGKVQLKIGTALLAGAKIAADISGITAAWEHSQAEMTARYAGYERRAADWVLQHNLATHELRQVNRQVLASLIAEQVAHHDYLMTRRQIEQSAEVDGFLRSKFTNDQLYDWLHGETARLYYEYYRFAVDVARRAERATKHELMRPEVDAQDFVRFNYFDGGRQGLLSGEALHLDVKRLEMAYLENNKREFELTRHVSLRRLAPAALLELKGTGTCEISIPEWLYDLDTPGHYLRRIRGITVTVPCVTGPYLTLPLTVTVTRSSLRTTTDIGDGYARRQGEDVRFTDYFGATASIVTSTAQNDSGLFEPGAADGRVLPFEGAGAESTWRLELPQEFRQVDYETIQDVVLSVRHTARQGGAPLRDAAVGALRELLAGSGALTLLLSLRHDFPVEWSDFTSGTDDFAAALTTDHFPYLAHGRTIGVAGIELYGVTAHQAPRHHVVGDAGGWAAASTVLNRAGTCTIKLPPDPPGPTRVLTRAPDADVWLLVRYTLS